MHYSRYALTASETLALQSLALQSLALSQKTHAKGLQISAKRFALEFRLV